MFCCLPFYSCMSKTAHLFQPFPAFGPPWRRFPITQSPSRSVLSFSMPCIRCLCLPLSFPPLQLACGIFLMLWLSSLFPSPLSTPPCSLSTILYRSSSGWSMWFAILVAFFVAGWTQSCGGPQPEHLWCNWSLFFCAGEEISQLPGVQFWVSTL